MPERIKEFKAVGNAVVGVLDGGAIERGYANEEQVLVCQCCSVPGWIAEEVAEEIARLLNTSNQTVIRGMAFSLPYKEVNIYDVEEET